MSSLNISLPVSSPREDVTHIKVSCDYEKGGLLANYLSGKDNPRGVYVYVRPVAVTHYGMERCRMFAGGKTLLEGMARLKPARLAHWQGEVSRELRDRTGKTWELVQKVCAEFKVAIREAA